MKLLRAFLFAAGLLPALACAQQATALFGDMFAAAEKGGGAAVAGSPGWLFLGSELRFLSFERFWGDAAAKASRAPKPELADPLPAIVDFQKQLAARQIELLVVPVPPKAAICSTQLLGSPAPDALAPLQSFIAELQKLGVEVLDLTTIFREARATVYCQTDTHWSPAGAELAAKQIAGWVTRKQDRVAGQPSYQAQPATLEIEGDLGALLPKGSQRPAKEKLAAQQVSTLDGKAVVPDPASPVLLLGDSHTLVFHEFAGERAGLFDHLALALNRAPDLIGTRGSGATAVRVSLYRKASKEPAWLAGKRFVIWCFAARELTESDQGWAKLPVAK